MVDACTWAAGEGDCDVDVEVTEMFRGYRIDSGSAARAGGRRGAAHAAGASPWQVDDRRRQRRERAARRAATRRVLLANGTEANHTSEESVTAEAMVQMLAVCEAAVELAAEGHPE